MGWLKNVGSLILNGSGATEKLLDAGLAGIDKLNLTEEERLDFAKSHYEKWHALQIALAEKGTGTAINRRILSWFVCVNVTFAFLVTLGFALAGHLEQARVAMEVAEHFKIGWAFSAVIVFYFGPHILGALAKV